VWDERFRVMMYVNRDNANVRSYLHEGRRSVGEEEEWSILGE